MRALLEAPTIDARGWPPPQVGPNALQVLERRYLSRDKSRMETPKDMFVRVASAVARADLLHGPAADVRGAARRFYDMLARLEFLPNSPTLMNAGRELGQLSACFVLPIEDSMESIFRTIKDTATIQKSGGGTGFSFSRLRPRGDLVRTTHGVSSGPISFLEVLNQATESVKQGGTRRGANMGVLRVDHPDVLEFIAAKEDLTRIVNFNLSVAAPDAFLRAVQRDEAWPLRNPRTGQAVKTVRARELFDRVAEAAWKSGEPGMLFLDRMNESNPTRHVAEIEATNPCGEQPLGPYDSCNLGSINLAKFVQGRGLDWARLRGVVHAAVHFLDNVIDVNRYPVEEIAQVTRSNRRVGLGVMGFADMLITLGVPYDSEASADWARRVMRFITAEARRESERLARERGEFPNWPGSLWEEQGHRPRRNATVTTIAPTGTLSMIADCSGGCEPLYALAYTKRVMEGTELVYVNELFERVAKERGFHSEELMRRIADSGSCQGLAEVPEDVQRLFRTAYDVSPEWHVRIQAAFQEHTENAVSKTINLRRDSTVEDVRAAYLLAFDLGCKGITVYRDTSRKQQVLSVQRKASPPETGTPGAQEWRGSSRSEGVGV